MTTPLQTFDRVDLVDNSNRVWLTYSADISGLPESVQDYVEHRAVEVVEDFAERFNTTTNDDAVAVIEGTLSVETSTTFNRPRGEIDAALSAIDGLTEQLRLDVLEQRRRHREWCNEKDVDVDVSRGVVPK